MYYIKTVVRNIVAIFIAVTCCPTFAGKGNIQKTAAEQAKILIVLKNRIKKRINSHYSDLKLLKKIKSSAVNTGIDHDAVVLSAVENTPIDEGPGDSGGGDTGDSGDGGFVGGNDGVGGDVNLDGNYSTGDANVDSTIDAETDVAISDSALDACTVDTPNENKIEPTVYGFKAYLSNNNTVAIEAGEGFLVVLLSFTPEPLVSKYAAVLTAAQCGMLMTANAASTGVIIYFVVNPCGGFIPVLVRGQSK